MELCLWPLAVWTELIKVLAPTNYVTREWEHFLLVNEGFSYGDLIASNCRGALAFPWEQEGCPCGSALFQLTGIFQLLALVFLAAQWGDESVCFVLVVRKWGVSRGCSPGSCHLSTDILAGLWEACSGCVVTALCDWDIL